MVAMGLLKCAKWLLGPLEWLLGLLGCGTDYVRKSVCVCMCSTTPFD